MSEPTYKMPSSTRLGSVHLVVNNLERELTFYTQVLGFHLHWQESGETALGTHSEVLLRLTEDPAAQRIQQATGMYHFAILYPSKRDLARAIARVFTLQYPNSPTDHGISMTTYLDDLEGNNIELYIRTLERATFEQKDGQMFVRYADGRIGSGRDPLDVNALFEELDEDEQLDLPLPDGTRIGHMHLYVSNMNATMDFYHRVLGFEEGPIFTGFRMGEVALDAEQPHVIAFNTWKGEGIPPAPADALGLRHFTVVLPSTAELGEVLANVAAAGRSVEETDEGMIVHDPSGIPVILTDQMPALK